MKMLIHCSKTSVYSNLLDLSGIRQYILFWCPSATAKAVGLYPESDSMVMSAPFAEREELYNIISR